MVDEKYKVEFHRGYDPDTKNGYYRVVLKSEADGRVIMDQATHYENDKQIYFCDIVNINIKEYGKDFPPREERRSMSEFFEEREEKGL